KADQVLLSFTVTCALLNGERVTHGSERVVHGGGNAVIPTFGAVGGDRRGTAEPEVRVGVTARFRIGYRDISREGVGPCQVIGRVRHQPRYPPGRELCRHEAEEVVHALRTVDIDCREDRTARAADCVEPGERL